MFLIIVVIIFLVPQINAATSGECDPTVGEGYQVGFGDDANCFYCQDNDELCADTTFGDIKCIESNTYDPDCTYTNEKGTINPSSPNAINYNFCGDNYDNDGPDVNPSTDLGSDGDGYQDYADGDCTGEEGLQNPTQNPSPVTEGNPVTISCPFSPTVPFNDLSATSKPGILIGGQISSCGEVSWSGNTASFSCTAGGAGQIWCQAQQYSPQENPTTYSDLNVNLQTCSQKGGTLSRPAGYMCDTTPASDGTCYVNCQQDLRDPDGDGLTTFEEETPGNDGFITNPNNPDTDGDGVSDGPIAPPGSGLTPGPDPDPTQGTEVCDNQNGLDEDGNGKCEYDSRFCVHGDSVCQVSIISATLSETEVISGTTPFDITCTVSPVKTPGYNSIFAYTDNNNNGVYDTGDTDFGWNDATDGWNSDYSKVSFMDRTVTGSGNKQINCGIYSSSSEPFDRSYQSGVDAKAATLKVVSSTCSERSQTDCGKDTSCKWVNECRTDSPKYSGDVGRCVETSTTINYACSVSQCSEQCDDSTTQPVVRCDDYCSGDNLYTRDNLQKTCQADSCTWDNPICSTGTQTSCGTTQCDSTIHLVGSCQNTCPNLGPDDDGIDETCQTCTPTCSCQSGYYDIDGSSANGCEYACTITNNGVEICDGLDNDCDGNIDNGLTAPSANKQESICAGSVKVCGGTSGWLEPDYTQITNYETTETSCSDLIDNDCDAESDYDTKQDLDMQFRHGESTCQVSTTVISLSKTQAVAGESFSITCTVTPINEGLNSIFAYIDSNGNGVYNTGETDFGWNDATDSWNADSSKVTFASRTISTAGTYKINCGIYSSPTEPADRSYQSGSDKTTTLTVIPSVCSERTQTNCENTAACKWVTECRTDSPKYSGDEGRCVDSSLAITYSCSVSQCSEQCDGGDWSACTDTNQCVGKVSQIRSPSCDTLNTCGCQYSAWVSEDCNVNKCNAECNAGYTSDTSIDYCGGDGNIYNEIEGCSNLCTITDAAASDTLSTTCSDACSDTDTGVDYTTQGTVTDYNKCSGSQTACPAPITKTDLCRNQILYPGQVTEFSCQNNNWVEQNYDCDNLDTITVNEGTDACSWEDHGCGTGACSLVGSEDLDCDTYDDIAGGDGTIADSETTTATCTYGCTGTSCCTSSSYTANGHCSTQDVEGTTYIDYHNSAGNNVWGTSANPTEICGDNFDNDCNGLIDEEDPQCVIVTSASAPSQVTQGNTFELTCSSTIDSNCIGTTIDSGTCTFLEWRGTDAIFNCQADIAGNIGLSCYISNKPDGTCTIAGETATPSPSSQTASTTAIASNCNLRSSADCSFDGSCEYCPTCGTANNPFETNPQLSSGYSKPGLCVTTGECSAPDKYQCRYQEISTENLCGDPVVECDANTWANCLGYETCSDTSCGCEAKPCNINNLGESSTHGETTETYICTGTTSSQSWTLSTAVLPENQYSCSDGYDNDGDGKIDCMDTDCEGLINGAGLTCCPSGGQPTCDALATSCEDFTACVDDHTQRGTSQTYTCSASKTCSANTPIACNNNCNTGCCSPGVQNCISPDTFPGSLADVEPDGNNEVCTSASGTGNWLGADCTLSGCTDTDGISYECIQDSDCSGSAGSCGEIKCINNQCVHKRVQDPITKCQTIATNQGYECAITDTDPNLACQETAPGTYNCIFFGDSYVCEDNYPLGYDAACSGDQTGTSNDYKCNINICNEINPTSCALCYSQCIDVATNEPTLAPFSVEECEVAKNAQWVNTVQCPAP